MGEDTCKYVISRGEKKGMICGLKNVNSDFLCAKHKKTGINILSKSAVKKQAPVSEELSIVTEDLVLYKNSQGLYIEPKSKFVFTTPTMVKGKLNINNEIEPLNNKDILIANIHGWMVV